MTNSFLIRSTLNNNNNIALLTNVSGQANETPEVISDDSSAAPSLNLQWIGDGDPSGFFFIKSAVNPSLVLNIKGASEASPNPNPTGESAFLDINPKIEPGWHMNQLWKFSLNAPGAANLFIESALTASNGQPFVLNIKGTSSENQRPTTGTQLDVTAKAGHDRELWIIEVPAGASGVVPGNSYLSTVTLSGVTQDILVQIKGTGFAPGWLSVGQVSVTGDSSGENNAGPQTNAGTVVNFDGTFETSIQLMSPFPSEDVTLVVFMEDSLGPYVINAAVSAGGRVQMKSQGRNVSPA